ncbi:MAG: tetratricopeptide repeat protein [Rhodospirillales bacterium]
MLSRLVQDARQRARNAIRQVRERFGGESLAARLQAAADLHRAGDLARARAAYLGILETDPANADALNLLGLMAEQQGKHDQALSYALQAIAQNPGISHYHLNCGLAYMAQGYAAQAIDCYVRAVQLDPQDARTHSILLFALTFAEGLSPQDILGRAPALAGPPRKFSRSGAHQ